MLNSLTFNQKATKRQPKSNQTPTKRVANANQTPTKKQPNANQKGSKRQPNANQGVFFGEAKAKLARARNGIRNIILFIRYTHK